MQSASSTAPRTAPTGSWSEHHNVDMCCEGDVEIVWNWRNTHSLEDLKRIVVVKGYSSVTVSEQFQHAIFKDFEFQLEPSHCRSVESCCGRPCTIHIYRAQEGSRRRPSSRDCKAHTYADALWTYPKTNEGGGQREAGASADNRSMARRGVRSPRAPMERELLEGMCGMTMSDAAASLDMSVPEFVEVCRRCGVSRWPSWRVDEVAASKDGPGDADESGEEDIVQGVVPEGDSSIAWVRANVQSGSGDMLDWALTELERAWPDG